MSTEDPVRDPSLAKDLTRGRRGAKRKSRSAVVSGSNAGRTKRTRATSGKGGPTAEQSDGVSDQMVQDYFTPSRKPRRKKEPTSNDELPAASGSRYHSPTSTRPSRVGSLDDNPDGVGGIEQLASAALRDASRHQSPVLNPFHYPFGLTPFRYPCHNSQLPPPPPGDPHVPGLERSDLYAHEKQAGLGMEAGSRSNHLDHSSPPVPNAVGDSPLEDEGGDVRPGSSLPIPDYPPLPPPARGGQTSFRANQAEVEANADAAYVSISALLTASQYPL